jgi:hypothetical protein
MSELKTKSESILRLFGKSLKNEILDYVTEQVELKFQEHFQLQLNSNNLLDAESVCKKYKISKSSLERYIREGLPFSSKSKGYKRLFKQKDLETWFSNKNINKKHTWNG